jgi:hypothetical protein
MIGHHTATYIFEYLIERLKNAVYQQAASWQNCRLHCLIISWSFNIGKTMKMVPVVRLTFREQICISLIVNELMWREAADSQQHKMLQETQGWL